MQLTTTRLLLRRWREDDLDAFAALNADPVVMEHFPSTLGRAASDAFAAAADEHLEREGWGLWALEVLSSGDFIGHTGLSVPRFEASFTPCVEIGWRLARRAWGHGYATEAAATTLDDAFSRLSLAEVLSFTAATNTRSQAVMRRLGMTTEPDDDFEHPGVPPGHRLSHHVLYRIDAPSWASRRRAGDARAAAR